MSAVDVSDSMFWVVVALIIALFAAAILDAHKERKKKLKETS